MRGIDAEDARRRQAHRRLLPYGREHTTTQLSSIAEEGFTGWS